VAGGVGFGQAVTPAPRRARATGVRRANVASRGATSCAGAPVLKTVSFSPFQIKFSPKIQTEILQALNANVVEQVTIYKNAKGSRVVYPRD
jgi:hypothetical protein